MHAAIVGIEYYLPNEITTTRNLSAMFPEWGVEKIDGKTGINDRHIAAEDECASDLAEAAARKLFLSGICSPEQIDFLILCTQSSDYVLPTTACLLQQRLEIPTSAGAFDVNLGCSGFVYGLGIAEGLIASKQARTILLITADTYSKYISRSDKTARTIFGDGAAATFIEARNGKAAFIGPFIYGTNGEGGENLIVRNSGTRRSFEVSRRTTGIDGDSDQRKSFLYMNGSRIFDFSITVIPQVVRSLLEKAEIGLDDVELFVFHQANLYILEELRRILNIPQGKFQITISHCANTVSSTIPIALKHVASERQLQSGALVMLVGFGVGYSWAATLIRWINLTNN